MIPRDFRNAIIILILSGIATIAFYLFALTPQPRKPPVAWCFNGDDITLSAPCKHSNRTIDI